LLSGGIRSVDDALSLIDRREGHLTEHVSGTRLPSKPRSSRPGKLLSGLERRQPSDVVVIDFCAAVRTVIEGMERAAPTSALQTAHSRIHKPLPRLGLREAAELIVETL